MNIYQHGTMSHLPSCFIAAALGATFGVLSVAGFFVYQRILDQQRYHIRLSKLDRVDRRIIELEIEQAKRKKRRKVAGTRVSNDSTHTTTANDTDIDAFSTTGTDIGDDEFYDCSDSDDTLENDTRAPESMNRLDSELAEIDRFTESEEKLEKDTYDQLQNLSVIHPENVEVIWRFARACVHYAAFTSKTDMKERIISEGIASCRKFFETYPSESADFHKWYAVLVGLHCDYLSTYDKVKNAHTFKTHVMKALELRYNDSTLHHLIGRFKYEMSSLMWYERMVVAGITSESPDSTYEDAISSLERAEVLATEPHLENRLYLAKAYIGLHQYPTAVHWLNRAVEPLAVKKNDYKIQKEAKQLLEKYA